MQLFRPSVGRVTKKVKKLLTYDEKKFYDSFLLRLSGATQEIREALLVVTRMNEEMNEGVPHGYSMWEAKNSTHPRFMAAWANLVRASQPIVVANAKIKKLVESVQGLGHENFIDLIQGTAQPDGPHLRAIIQSLEKTDLGILEQFGNLISELQNTFKAYDKFVDEMLEAYHKELGKKGNASKSVLLRYRAHFKTGMAELDETSTVLRKGKKHIKKELESDERAVA